MRPQIRYGLYAALLVAASGLFFAYRQPIFAVVKDPDAIRAWLEGLGPWGPVGLIALFALQILIAPVPGYVFQVIAGYLFGWGWGTVYSTIGMLIGGVLAMSLARIYGRPLVSKAVGADRLQRWENVTHLNSLGLWFLLMLGPLGDMLFFLAGLDDITGLEDHGRGRIRACARAHGERRGRRGAGRLAVAVGDRRLHRY